MHAAFSSSYFSKFSNAWYQIAQLAASYNIKQYVSSVLLLALVTSICYMWNLSDVATVRVSQGIVTVMMIMIPACICLFKPRAALHPEPKNQLLISIGFWKLTKKGYEIIVKHWTLKIICCSLLCSEATDCGNLLLYALLFPAFFSWLDQMSTLCCNWDNQFNQMTVEYLIFMIFLWPVPTSWMIITFH